MLGMLLIELIEQCSNNAVSGYDCRSQFVTHNLLAKRCGQHFECQDAGPMMNWKSQFWDSPHSQMLISPGLF